jgi:alpha-beta hydrolase superfamily lysophospholipase
MTKTIILIHGAWVTPASLETFRSRYAAMGYSVIAPAWPMLDRPVVDLRQSPAADLGKLTLGKIVDHYASIIATLPEQPILIGHSYGGLIVQMLLDRGLGAAGVSISPGPAAGIHPGPKAFLSAFPVFAAWRGWSRALTMSFKAFAKNFANTLPAEEQQAAYEAQIVPAPGRIYYQSVLGLGSAINWSNPARAPLLLISAEHDRTVEPSMVQQAYKKYQASTAITELKGFADRSHYLIAERGWEEVADYALSWAEGHVGGAVPFQRAA